MAQGTSSSEMPGRSSDASSAPPTVPQNARQPFWAAPWNRSQIRIALVWAGVAVGLTPLALLSVGKRPESALSDFFLGQDLPLLAWITLTFLFGFLPSLQLSPSAAGRVAYWAGRGPWVCAMLATAVGMIGVAGWLWPYHSYPLSLDEFWASFDTAIFKSGRLLAEVAPEWRSYVPALQPMWRLETAGNTYWGSSYLPMNAAIRALFTHLGSASLAEPFWAALSVFLVYQIARNLWPDRRDAALVAAVLLASSSQLLVTAMSPYAMSPHLALNLAWLWLMLRRGIPAQGAALVIGFVATGLHQVIFHPLFAAPFLLQMWIARRWSAAAVHTLAYAGICLFWISYWSLLLESHGVSPESAGIMAGSNYGPRVVALVQAARPSAIGMMAENLIRFITWQNPWAVALGLLAVPTAAKAWRSPLGPLVAGIGLTAIVVGIVLPYQGHGWGYRYLHGFLGSLCLLASCSWVRLTPVGEPVAERRAWAALGATTAAAMLILLPIRLAQVHQTIRPFEAAFRKILSSRAEIVLVNTTGIIFGIDLIRNDPLLKREPMIMAVDALRPEQIRDLCSNHRLELFDLSDAPQLKARNVDISRIPLSKGLAELTRHPACAPHVGEAIDEAPGS